MVHLVIWSKNGHTIHASGKEVENFNDIIM